MTDPTSPRLYGLLAEYDNADAVARDLVVTLLRAAVEAERVLEPGAAAALHREAQHLGLSGRLLRHERADLHRRLRGEGDDGGLELLGGSLDGGHELSVAEGVAIGTS